MAARVLLAALALATAAHGASEVTFAVMGDWGWGPDGDRSLLSSDDIAILPDDVSGQKHVAAAMGQICKSVKCQFVLNTGDNFYNLGINSELGVTDPQWETSFNQIYNAPSLAKIPFIGVLGNHDYGRASAAANHSIQPQLEYTFYDPHGRWYIPGRYYQVRPVKAGPAAVQITALDSSVYLDSYCAKPTAKYYTDELLYGCQDVVRAAQMSSTLRNLKAAKAAKMWSVAVGHHPPISAADGKYKPYYSLVQPVLSATGASPDLWFNGHDHVLNHFLNPEIPNTNFFTIGASGIAQVGDTPEANNSTFIDQYKFSSGEHGFAIVTLGASSATVKIYTVDLTKSVTAKPTLAYTTTISKNSA